MYSLFPLRWACYSFLSQPKEFPQVAEGPPGQYCNASARIYGCAAFRSFLQSSFRKHFTQILCHYSPGQNLSAEQQTNLHFGDVPILFLALAVLPLRQKQRRVPARAAKGQPGPQAPSSWPASSTDSGRTAVCSAVRSPSSKIIFPF